MITKYEQPQAILTVSSRYVRQGYPPRFHRDLELVWLEEGFLEILIDNSLYRLEAGDVYVLFPNIPHNVTAQDCRKHLIMLNPALLPDFTKLFSQSKPLCPILPADKVPNIVPLLFQRCSQLHAEGAQQNALVSHINSILHELLPRMPQQQRSSDLGLIEHIVEYIYGNYSEDISLDKLAGFLGYSKFHISRCLNDTFGCNFRALVNNHRINAAEEMLLHTENSVLQIAYACGFQNQSSFNKAFLKYCGMTPTQYRATNRSDKKRRCCPI